MRFTDPRSWSLAVKFPLTITGMIAGVGLTICAVIAVQNWRWLNSELEKHALLLAGVVAVNSPETILRDDYWSLYKDLKKMTANVSGGSGGFNMETGMVLDLRGRVLAHLDPSSHPLGLPLEPESAEERHLLEAALKVTAPGIFRGNGFIEGVAPIYSDEKRLAVVRLRLSTSELYAQTRKAVLTVLGVTIVLVAAGSLLGALVSRRLVRPLTELAEGMESVGRDELNSITPVSTHNQDEIGHLAAAFNRMAVQIEEKKRLEKKLAVNEKMIALGRIAAGVAHEVNNPLAGMLNCLDNIKKHPNESDLLDRYLPLIERGLIRIHTIVNGLLGELRIEDARKIDPPSCLEEVRELVRAEIGDRDIIFSWENKLGDHLRINSQRVQQVVFNLLKNAIEFMPKSGELFFHAFEDGREIILEIKDNGPGIPPENLNKLFDPFFTTRPHGTGLGLWIVYGLVKSMNGRIDVDSTPGRGSLFRVFLPAMDEKMEEAAA